MPIPNLNAGDQCKLEYFVNSGIEFLQKEETHISVALMAIAFLTVTFSLNSNRKKLRACSAFFTVSLAIMAVASLYIRAQNKIAAVPEASPAPNA